MRTAVSDEHAAVTARDVSTLSWLLSLVHPDDQAAARIRQLGDRIDQIHAQAMRDGASEALHHEERRVRAELRAVAGLPR